MRCWSCGSDLAGGLRHFFTCPLCSAVEEQKKIRKTLESFGSKGLSVAVEAFGPDFGEITGILEAGFGEMSAQLADIASILEWGFEEIEWKLDQIRGTLKDIERTLKTPATTQANEWRRIAEELRRRGVLDESEKFFLKSLESNPLDYRTYIGLGKTYLQIGEGDKARVYWEKSFPHAPKKEIDYKSYSYRLIGRTYFCEDNIQKAAQTLKTAIELSPNYYLGHYDYAQYCALVGDKDNCLSSLRLAVVKAPFPFTLVEREKNFEPLRKEIETLWKEIISNEDLLSDPDTREYWLRQLRKWVSYLLDEAEREFKKTKETILSLYTEEEINDIVFNAQYELVRVYHVPPPFYGIIREGEWRDEWRIRNSYLPLPNTLKLYKRICSQMDLAKEARDENNPDEAIRYAKSIIDDARMCREEAKK